MSNREWIWKYAKQVKGYLTYATILFVLEAAANIGVVGIQKFIVDDLFVQRNFNMLLPLLAGLAGLAVGYNVLHLYAALVRNKAVFKLQRLLLFDMLNALHRIPVKRFREERTGKYVTHLTDDINQTADLVGSRIPMGIMEISSAIMLTIIIMLASPFMLLAIIGVSIVYIVLGKYFSPKVKQAAKASAASNTEVIVGIEEGIASSREVIAYHREQWESGRLRSKLNKHFSNLMKQVDILNRQELFSMIMQWGVRVFVLVYGGVLVMNGNLSIGWLVVIFQFATQLMQSYEKVYQIFMGMAGSLAAVERVREVLEGEQVAEGSVSLTEPVQKLRLERITFQYNDTENPIIQNLSLELPLGKKIAFVGTSGGGKSTIAQLLIRFYDPHKGEISVNDQPLSQIRREDWTERIAIVFQEAYLFPETIRHNLIMGRDLDENTMEEICKRMCIHEFIESLPDGYDTQVGERGIQLSGGQRQRLALARALLADSEILILDEATSALDMETERHVQQQLDELRKGKTTIIIAHRLSTIIDADIIYVLDDGQVKEQGTHKQLIEQDNVYSQLVMKRVAPVQN